MSKVNVLISGATGYIGIQLVKLLSKHKKINIKFLCGSSSVGKNISFHLFEVYKNSAALDFHRNTSHYKNYRSKIVDLLDRPIEVKVLTSID